MNYLNDPQDWNIRPERQGGGGDSSKWDFALLDGSKEYLKEIEEVKVKYEKTVKTIQKDLDVKYCSWQLSVVMLTRWIWSKQFQKKITEALASQNQKFKEERCRPGKGKKKQEQTASAVLKEVEYRLMKRQEMFCSNLVHYSWNVKMEDELLNFAAQLKVVDGLRDIFKNDRSCAEYLNTDPRRNGCLMWLYLRYWQLQVTLQTHQRAEAAVLGPQTKE
uniref:Coiled-coil domain containing 127b n=1 Tax=Cyprinus carpio TaxID=7962 RepID=A0A8C2H5Z5_CYPCA